MGQLVCLCGMVPKKAVITKQLTRFKGSLATRQSIYLAGDGRDGWCSEL